MLGKESDFDSCGRVRAVAVWLAAFFSPTIYFLLLVAAAMAHVPNLPGGFVVAAFCLLPFIGLLVCWRVIRRSTRTVSGMVSWGAVTVIGMVLQVGVLLVIILSAINAAIGYAG